MFLKNERSLGVKNGSLGRVDSVGAARMSVLLDDGRAVPFDLKDYAHVDHGYAATIHKAQGATVDKVHVLATPGMDRHAAYVALSRHRDRMDLHYGRDDFADRKSLVRTLSRERGKDMASDYVREFADRRAIILPARTGPVRQLDMFEGLAIAAGRPPEQVREKLSLHESVVRFAKATAEIVHRRRQGLEATPEQKARFDAARRTLDELKPGSARDLRAAFVRDMGLIDDAVSGNTGPAIGAMDWERRYRTDPQLRADHFVKTWRQLGDRHEMFERRGDEKAADRVRAQMTVFAKSLERDPQVESLLRNRHRELGMPPFVEQRLSQSLPSWIGWGRGRGLER